MAVVHAGYARWRKKLLRYGVSLRTENRPANMKTAVHDRGLTGENSGSSWR